MTLGVANNYTKFTAEGAEFRRGAEFNLGAPLRTLR
jgi:hypothetical protein